MPKQSRSLRKIVALTIIATLAICAIAFAIGFSYNFFVLKPQMGAAQLKEKRLNTCLDVAHKKYIDRWGKNCKNQNEKIDKDGKCPLHSSLVDHLDQEYKNLRDECLTRYK